MIKDIQAEIIRLKKENDFYVLAHSYQAREIIEVADFVGDSFQLSLAAQKATQQNILMCGVHFMAETVKMLSPEKGVYLANEIAGCPMAEQLEPEMIMYLKKQNPGFSVVAYINTTAALKTVSDVCVTSSTAVKIVEKMDTDNIIFIPDCNLGDYVSKQLPNKNIMLVQGGCPIHAAVTKEDALIAKKAHPNAKLLVHPECLPEVVELADYVGSTSGIMDFVKSSDEKEFIIGTEISIAEHMQYDNLNKTFYVLSKKLICPNMRVTTLVDVYNTLKGEGGIEIKMDDETIKKARVCVDEMIRLGK